MNIYIYIYINTSYFVYICRYDFTIHRKTWMRIVDGKYFSPDSVQNSETGPVWTFANGQEKSLKKRGQLWTFLEREYINT